MCLEHILNSDYLDEKCSRLCYHLKQMFPSAIQTEMNTNLYVNNILLTTQNI